MRGRYSRWRDRPLLGAVANPSRMGSRSLLSWHPYSAQYPRPGWGLLGRATRPMAPTSFAKRGGSFTRPAIEAGGGSRVAPIFLPSRGVFSFCGGAPPLLVGGGGGFGGGSLGPLPLRPTTRKKNLDQSLGVSF